MGYRQLVTAHSEATSLAQVSLPPCIPHPSCRAGMVTVAKGAPMVSWAHWEGWDITLWFSDSCRALELVSRPPYSPIATDGLRGPAC